MTEQLINSWISFVLPTAISLLCLGAALAILNIIFINKGAKANLAWGLLAASFILFGIVEGNRVVAVMDLPNINEAADALKVLAALFAFSSAIYMRSLFKRLLK
jgi:hypothetical protein